MNNQQVVIKSDRTLYFLNFDPSKGEDGLEVQFELNEEIKEGIFFGSLFFYLTINGRVKVVIGQKSYGLG